MRVPLSWLREYVDVDLDPQELAARLTVLGMEVKALDRWGGDWGNVVVGELLDVRRHPRADRLSLTRVAVGDGSAPLEIVCGATNIAVGQRVPVALPGAVLPGGRRIERAEKLGVTSNGMLCSGEELGLTADGDGILILPPASPIGTPLVDLYGDWVLDVDVKPNRGDALSLVGLAREVAIATGGSVADVRLPETDVLDGSTPVESRLAVDVRDPGLCPRFVGRTVAGVEVGPSPDWVQMRLLAAGMRPVSNVVDATNYVLLELGKPVHAFDSAAVTAQAGGPAGLVVRRARDGERLETLDHVVRDLTPDTLIIADAERPLAIAGVMGGASSEVSDATRDVIVESAIFDPISIRRTAFRYALRSEASLRFEKGLEGSLARVGADRTARLIHEWAGGEVARGRIDSAPDDEPGPLRVTFRPGRVNALLGTDIAVDEQRALLERVGVVTEESPAASLVTVATVPDLVVVEPTPGESVDALVPAWRRDIAIEADVAEEVARLEGYETVPAVTPDTPMPSYRPNPLDARDVVRSTLAGAGLHEVVTYALVAPDEVEAFPLVPDVGIPEGEDASGGRPIRVTNPLSSQHSVLRQRLLPSLLRIAAFNQRQGRDDVAIFEIGKGYGANGDVPQEWWRLAIVLAGPARPGHWSESARAWDLDDAKGVIELICAELGFAAPAYAPLRDDPTLHPGRAATAVADAQGDTAPALAGRVGELHPRVADELELRAGRVLVAELAVRGLTRGTVAPVQVVPPPRHPAVDRDLAIVVGEDVAAADVSTSIRRHGGPLLVDVRLFDVYRGAPLAPTEKSLAHRLVFRGDRTLTESEVDEAIASIVSGIERDVSGRVRS